MRGGEGRGGEGRGGMRGMRGDKGCQYYNSHISFLLRQEGRKTKKALVMACPICAFVSMHIYIMIPQIGAKRD